MKDLIGKIATISVPGVLDGEQEKSGFEYSPDGTQLRWDRMPVGIRHVHISQVSVHGTPRLVNPKAAAAPERKLTLADVPEDVRRQIAEQAVAAAGLLPFDPKTGGTVESARGLAQSIADDAPAGDARQERGNLAPSTVPGAETEA